VVEPGQFVQVEFMIRDSTKYQTAAGWGWGRWIGTDLKPDGHTADFASTHCVDCHHAVRRNDYVFTMPINVQQRRCEVTTIRVLGAILLILSIGCSQPNACIQTRLNRDAEFSGEASIQPSHVASHIIHPQPC
jgi:hypothetical protein